MQWIFTDIPVSWIFQGGRHSKEMNWKESKTQQIKSQLTKYVQKCLKMLMKH